MKSSMNFYFCNWSHYVSGIELQLQSQKALNFHTLLSASFIFALHIVFFYHIERVCPALFMHYKNDLTI